MSWTETHRFYDALHTIEADLDDGDDGVVAWRPEYGEIFGEPARLALVLRTRWDTMVDAQVERYYADDGRPSDELLSLAANHRGLLRAVARSDRSGWHAALLADVDLASVA